MVFCVPSARPLQNGPATSAIAVKANPLSETVTTDATTISATLIGESSQSVSASSPIDTAAAAAIVRMGPIRELSTSPDRRSTKSDHRPAAMRPPAPKSCATVTIAPADPADHPLSVINQASVNVHTIACGATSSSEVRWMRTSSEEPRYGLARSASLASARAGRGGSSTATAHTTAAAAQTTAGNSSAPDTPRD